MRNYNIRLPKKINYFLFIYLHIFITIIILSYFSFFIPTFIEAENSSSITNSTEDILNKANVLLDLQKYDEALQYYDKVLAIDPNNIDTMNDKANVLEDLERYDEATTVL